VGFFYSRYEWQSGFATPELSGIKRHVIGAIGRGREFHAKRQRGEARKFVARRKGGAAEAVLMRLLVFLSPLARMPVRPRRWAGCPAVPTFSQPWAAMSTLSPTGT